ncbi:MAG: NAD(P)-dependent oxidoreductase [Pseudorhodoplanes sp.]|nr:NAD(P)-dependent oxidoreductase [Pseudorhodoplanes sp.]
MARPVVAIIAPGHMGAGIAARLAENGVTVLTSLDGRSEASRTRAAKAAMTGASDRDLAAVDIILSIVPPGEALALAERLAPALRAANARPVYVDCNAVSPQTARRIAAVIEETGTPFVDGGIIGGPPRAGYGGPVIYISGTECARVETLNEFGLVIRRLDGGIGAASAIKMSYGGITKGLTAVGTAMALAASRAGVADALHAELAASQPALLAYLTRSVPDMFGKAYRWVAEMEEIAAFTGREAEGDMYEGIADLFGRLAADNSGGQADIAHLREFFARPPTKAG